VSLVGRFAQGLSAIHPRLPPDRDMILIESLSPAQRMAFLALPAYDQPHLCTVYRTLRSSGEMDADLLQAALLHDIGKVAIGGRVRLFDRVLLVVLGVSSPRLLEKTTKLPSRRWRLGLALAHHHPSLGSEWAELLGCSPRTCWLISHHADHSPPDDPQLLRLIGADQAS
jgi:hypothetical protein